MRNFPDDADARGYAYVCADRRSSDYGHLRMVIRTPALDREYPKDAVSIILKAQYGGAVGSPHEPSYGWHLTVSDNSEGLEVQNLQRTAKEVGVIQKRVAELEKRLGRASTLAEHMSRLFVASRVRYCYVAWDIDDRRPIPEMRCMNSDDMSDFVSAVSSLGAALAKRFPAT